MQEMINRKEIRNNDGEIRQYRPALIPDLIGDRPIPGKSLWDSFKGVLQGLFDSSPEIYLWAPYKYFLKKLGVARRFLLSLTGTFLFHIF